MVEQNKSRPIRDSDADLVKRARYDPEAFGLLYERHYDREYRIAYNKTGNREGAKDIVARAFENALGSLCFPKDPSKEFQMRKESSFVSWIDTINYHEIADSLNEGSKHRTQSLEDLPEEQLWDCDVSNPQEEAERAETRQEVRAALNKLSEDDFEVIKLSVFDGLSPKEIGQFKGVSRNSVNQQLFRAMRRFKGVYLQLYG